MNGFLYLLLALVVVVSGLAVRRRLRRGTGRDRSPLTDEDLRRIREEGTLERDEAEPLDMDEARREEERFWSESWDEPESLWE